MGADHKNRMDTNKMKRPVWTTFPVCLAVSILLTVIPFAVTGIYYLFGDDYLMNYIANGSFGPDSSHLVFISYPVGLLLKGCYAVLPDVNWYAALLGAVFAVSFAVIHHSIQRTTTHPLPLIVSLAANAAAVPLFLTFTVAAFIAIGAGLASAYAALRKSASFKGLIPGVLMILAGYLIRSDCLIPALGIAFPAYAFLLTDRERRRMLISRAAAGCAVLMVLIGASVLVEKAAYSSEAWQSYRDFNEARSSVLDYPLVAYDSFADEFQSAGYSRNAYVLMNRWTFAEKQVFTPGRMRAVSAIMHSAYTPSYRFRYMTGNLKTMPGPMILLIPLLLLAVLMLTDRSYRKVPGVLTVLMFYAVIAALCVIRLRYLLRVSCPLCFIAVVFVSLLCEKMPSAKQQRLILAGGTVLMLCAMFLFGRSYTAQVAPLRDARTAASYKKLRKEIDRHPDRTYVVESPIYVWLFIYGHTVDEIKPSDTFSHVIRAGSWDNFSPRYYKIANDRNIRDPDNLLSSLMDADHLYLVTENTDFVTNFLTAEYGTPCAVLSEKKKGPATIAKIGRVS